MRILWVCLLSLGSVWVTPTLASGASLRIAWAIGGPSSDLYARGDAVIDESDIDDSGFVDLVAAGADTDVVVRSISGPDVLWSLESSTFVLEFESFGSYPITQAAQIWSGMPAASTACPPGAAAPCEWTSLRSLGLGDFESASFRGTDVDGQAIADENFLAFSVLVIPEPSIASMLGSAAFVATLLHRSRRRSRAERPSSS